MASEWPVERSDIAFQAGDGTTLRGWLYRPETNGTPHTPTPGVVMTHGFAAVKEHHLDAFARRFSALGLTVLLYDHRNCGASDGFPRYELDPWQQIRDTRDAITWLCAQPGIDRERIGLWGSSYSGGHALVLGAIDRRVRCVVAQVPTISGYQQSLRRVRPDAIAAMRDGFDADRVARFRGAEPATRAVVPARPGDPAVYPGDDARAFYLSAEPDRSWPNAVTLRSLEMASEYEPGVYVPRITPTPLLMIVADRDDVTPTDLALEAFGNAREPKKLVLVRGGHFSPYGEKLDESSGAASDWFGLHLLGRGS